LEWFSNPKHTSLAWSDRMVGMIYGEMQEKHDEQGPHDEEKSGERDHPTKRQGEGRER